ncbi:MAG: hypothetical protein [Bacteriophage sp.]|nr:MAG: hypothetical protein [Bacteriophage sp.]
MGKFLKRVFNSLIFNVIIILVAIILIHLININIFPGSSKLSVTTKNEVIFFLSFISFFFFLNSLLLCVDSRAYQSNFTDITFWAILAFVIIFPKAIFSLNSWLFSYYRFLTFVYAAGFWSIYLNYCIRTLSSINVGCSVFVAITVKAILIAIVAWLALYKDLETDKSRTISFIASYISLCYPIIDMFKYVRLELDKYLEKNAIK